MERNQSKQFRSFVPSLFMIFLLYISTFALLSSRVFSLKFGVVVKSENRILNDKFVIFGTVPDTISDADRDHIKRDLMKFVEDRNNLKNAAGMEDADVYAMSIMNHKPAGNLHFQSNVAQELSNMLLNFRIQTMNNYSNFNSKSKPSIWTQTCFYSDPVILLTKNELETLGNEHQYMADSKVVYKVKVNIVDIRDANVEENYTLNLINISGNDVSITPKIHKSKKLRVKGSLNDLLLDKHDIEVNGELRPKATRSCSRCVIC